MLISGLTVFNITNDPNLYSITNGILLNPMHVITVLAGAILDANRKYKGRMGKLTLAVLSSHSINVRNKGGRPFRIL